MNPPANDPTALLTHDGHLRALARALVREASAADDLAQDAWLAALEARVEARSWPAWLATVARRLATKERRTSARRAQREERAARAEAAPSTAELLEREEARARVVAALLALAEPLRTTLVLRFLEDLPPRAVARRMQVPVETVRTRTRRGLEALRAELDGSFGARERWLSALVPLARLHRFPLGPTLAAMSIQTKVVVALAVVLLCAWWLWPHAAVTATGSSVVAAVAPAASVVTPELAPGPRPSAPTQESARARIEGPPPTPALAATASGALRVHVTWFQQHHDPVQNAVDFGVRVTSNALENPELNALAARTDGDGLALFEGLPAGRALVTVDREFGPARTVDIVPGTTVETTIAIEHGFTILGRVTDERDQPVAGAEIWFGKFPDLANGTRIATSAVDGSFVLHALNHANLGARASGYRPSRIAYFYAASGAEVQAHLMLRAGAGEVDGVVLGAAGEPLEDALVRVGPPGPANGFGAVDDDWGTTVRSDEQGRFRVAGLASGACPIVVRKDGFAMFRGELEVPEGATAAFTATLAPEAALEGHVRDSLGRPVAGALVRVGEEAGPFRASARSGDDGGYRVGALEAGRTLSAWVEDAPGHGRTEFTTAVGRTEVWEATLDPLREIRGRVLDERGAELANWEVRLEEQEPVPEPDEGYLRTEADGGFVFTTVHDRPHALSVTAPGAGFAQSLVRFGVRPGPEEVELVVLDRMLPTARIVGSLLDEAGHALPSAELMAWSTSAMGSVLESCDPRTGRFDLGPYPPGEVRFIVRVAGRGTLVREHVLAAGETWDVGELRLEPEGRLRVRLLAAELEPSAALVLACEPGCFDPFEGQGDERLSPPLAPGQYTLSVGGGEYEELALPFAIEGGAETRLDVPLRRGWKTPVEVRAPESVALGFLSVQMGDGSVRKHTLWKREGEMFVETLRLPVGTFALEVRAGELRASGTVVVEPVDREEAAVRLELE